MSELGSGAAGLVISTPPTQPRSLPACMGRILCDTAAGSLGVKRWVNECMGE